MEIKTVNINSITPHSSNPRLVKDAKFKKLVASVKSFPQMLDIRPIVVNRDMVIIGGNMRYKACIEAGFKKIPIIVASHLNEKQQEEFMLKDNVSTGEWDYDVLAEKFEPIQLSDFGVLAFDVSEEDLREIEAPKKNLPNATAVDEEIEEYQAQHETEVNKDPVTSAICPHCGK